MKQEGPRQFLKEGHLNFLLIFIRLGTHESGFCDENISIYSFNKYLLNAFCGCVLSVTGQRVYHLKKGMLCIYIIRSLGRNAQELYKVLAMYDLICDATGYSQRSPCIHFIGSQVNKSCRHQLWYFHTYVTLTRKLSHWKEQWLSVISDNLKKIEILPDHVKFNSTNLHTQQFSIYLPYLLLEILLFAEQTKSPFTRW